jgi:hypothetical protein
MLKDSQDELAILRQKHVDLDKDHERQIPAIVRRLQELRRWIQMLMEGRPGGTQGMKGIDSTGDQ